MADTVQEKKLYSRTDVKLHLTVVTSESGFDELKASWNRLTRSTDTTVFQTYDWNRLWWTHFGQQQKLNLVLYHHGSQLVGIAPLFLNSVSIAGRTIYSTLRFLGSNLNEAARGSVPRGHSLCRLSRSHLCARLRIDRRNGIYTLFAACPAQGQ